MGRIQMAAIVLAAIAIASAGCGSSAKPLTRAQLTAKADVICKSVTAKLASKTIKTKRDIARVAPELASFEQTALTELSKLVPPAALANDWKQFVAGAQTLAESISKLGEYAQANNLKGARGVIRTIGTVQQQMVTIAKRDRLKDCQQVV
jgi:soluble cytochrome b562